MEEMKQLMGIHRNQAPSDFVTEVINSVDSRLGRSYHEAAIAFSAQCKVGDSLTTRDIAEWAISNGFMNGEFPLATPPIIGERTTAEWRLLQDNTMNFIYGLNKAGSHPRFLNAGHEPFEIVSVKGERNRWTINSIPSSIAEFDFYKRIVEFSKTIEKRYERVVSGLDTETASNIDMLKATLQLQGVRRFVKSQSDAWHEFKESMSILDLGIEAILRHPPARTDDEIGQYTHEQS